MVLCVSNVTWTDAGEDEHGEPVQKPELEVTDGWYRLRAQIDGPLERAVKRGAIRIGRKIAVAGARVCWLSRSVIVRADNIHSSYRKARTRARSWTHTKRCLCSCTGIRPIWRRGTRSWGLRRSHGLPHWIV